MSSQPQGIDLNEIASQLSVREVPYSSRQAKLGYQKATGNFRPARDTGEPVRLVTTKIKRDEILRLLLINKTTREIATDLRMSIGTVRDYIRDGEFQRQLKAISEPIWARCDEELRLSKLSKIQRLDEMGDRALTVLSELLDSEDEKVQMRAVDSVLDRNKETGKRNTIDTTQRVMILDVNKLQLAAQTALELENDPRLAARGFINPSSSPEPTPLSKDVDGVKVGLPDAG